MCNTLDDSGGSRGVGVMEVAPSHSKCKRKEKERKWKTKGVKKWGEVGRQGYTTCILSIPLKFNKIQVI